MSEDFVGNIYKQNCGDSLLVLEKTDKKGKTNHNFLFRCKFLNYPCEILALKYTILKGLVFNPQIEQVEFIDKIWPQHCGDSLRIIKKSEKKQGNIALFECEFIKYPFKIFATKSIILKGNCKNPRIEEEEFLKKEWKQFCGDSLRILKKTDKKRGTSALYECIFINYPYKVLDTKGHILRGTIGNPNMPWTEKSSLESYINNTFKNKPTAKELAESLNISTSFIYRIINKFCLNNLINYYSLEEENQVREFIKSIYNREIIKYSGKKEDNYYEIDIYLPELKKGIEYNGTPWHEEGNLNNKFSKSIGYHQRKQEFFIKKGIDILFVWDYEWFEDFPKRQIISEQIKQRIRNFLGV